MKNLIVFGCLLVAGVALANDTHLNPDRVPSMGLDFNRYYANGILAKTPITLPDGREGTHISFTGLGQTNIVADLRLPLNNYFTVDVHGGPTSMNYQGVGIDGWQGGASVRMYFHPGIFHNQGR